MNLFYSTDLQHTNTLSEEESAHAVRVLRLKVGDAIDVIDGKGLHCKAIITLAHPRHTEFQTVEKIMTAKKRSGNLHIAIAPTKNIDRFEWFVEKATEIGISTITPLVCHFSERKVLKPERLEKIVVAACKQSQNFYFPEIKELVAFGSFVENIFSENCQKFIAHCYEGEKPLLQTVYRPATDTVILIGPEGDFSRQEVELAVQKCFMPVSLGNSRLRTETAGIVACTTAGMVEQTIDN
ncbi:ribosomal RNA small subunit methyltransferase E [Bacteroidia bacterium]|nr:ribosomal RNA small subunit methyltransferase E [Bacteroidia bacterium]